MVGRARETHAKAEIEARIELEIAELRSRKLELEERDNREMSEASLRARFDDTDRGKLMHRHESDLERGFFRGLKEARDLVRWVVQVEGMKPVTPTSKMCRLLRMSRTGRWSGRGTSLNTVTARFMETGGRAAGCSADERRSGCLLQPSRESSFSREIRPSIEPLAIHASGPRGRTTGASSRPVA